MASHFGEWAILVLSDRLQIHLMLVIWSISDHEEEPTADQVQFEAKHDFAPRPAHCVAALPRHVVVAYCVERVPLNRHESWGTRGALWCAIGMQSIRGALRVVRTRGALWDHQYVCVVHQLILVPRAAVEESCPTAFPTPDWLMLGGVMQARWGVIGG